MKKAILLILILLLLCGSIKSQEDAVLEVVRDQDVAIDEEIEQEVAIDDEIEQEVLTDDETLQGISIDDEKGYILKSFDYYHNSGSVFNTFEFLMNPKESKDKYLSAGEKLGFRFVDENGRLHLDNMCSFGKKQYYDLYTYFAFNRGFYRGEHCSDAVAFLCDEEAIRECFSKNGVRDIRDIIIFSLTDHKTGYAIAALTENEAYYMTIPFAKAEYGDYIYQKVYTSEEFKKIYSPRKATVYIDGKKMNFPSVTLLGENYIEIDLFSFLEAIGHKSEYDSKKQEFVTERCTLKIKYNNEAGELRRKYNEFIEFAPECTVTVQTADTEDKNYSAVIRNGRVLIGHEGLDALCGLFKYDYKYNYNDYSVYLDDHYSEVPLKDEIGEHKLKRFGYYHNEGSIYNTFPILKNPFADEEYMYGSSDCFLFKEVDGKLVLDGMPGHNEKSHNDLFSWWSFIHSLSPSEYCSDAIAFLCDEEAIRECFSKSGVRDIRDIKILGFMDEKVGYIAVALTENDAYYMPIPLAEAEYGDYIYQKVYTSEEFKKIYSPREATVYINGIKPDSPIVAILGEKYLEMDLISFLEAIGYECKYDSEKQEITAGKYTLDEYVYNLVYDEEATESRKKYADFLEVAPVYKMANADPLYDYERFVLKNGRFLANEYVIKSFCNRLGYEIEYQFDDMSIHIFKK